MSSTAGNRIASLDTAKGIGIILVVWAHARGPFSPYIYLFHMPFFFIISGYLHKFDISFPEFLKRRFFSLYIPFVFWNFIFYIFRTLYTAPGKSPADIGKNLLTILLTIGKDSKFGGATWFLGALFSMAVLYKLMEQVLHDPVLLLVVWVVIGITAFNVNLPFYLSRTLILGMYYAVGAFVRSYRHFFEKYYGPVTAAAAAVLFFVINNGNSSNMAGNRYNNAPAFAVGSCLASYAVVYLAGLIASGKWKPVELLNRAVSVLGKRSLDILIWHFSFFILIYMLQMVLAGEGFSLHAAIAGERIYDGSGLWWLVYLTSGLILPLLWTDLLRMGPWGRLLKKLHAV